MKKAGKIFKLFITLTVIGTLFVLAALGINAEVSGNCKTDGSGYTWSFNEETKVLTISGSSESTTLGFTTPANWQAEAKKNIPWYDHLSAIEKVVIEESTGITAIQQYALSNLANCKTIILPTTAIDFSAYNILANNTKLSAIAYADSEAVEGVYDFSKATSINSQLFEESAKGLTVTLKVGTATLPTGIIKWFTPTTTVNFEVINGTPMSKWLKNYEAGTDTRNASFLFKINDITYTGTAEDPTLVTSGKDTVDGNYSWSFDTETGTLTFKKLKDGWCELYFSNKHTDFLAWLENFRENIKHIVVPAFSKYQDANSQYPFSNLPGLETVKWDTTRMMSTGGKGNNGVFAGCAKLTSFGTSKNFEEGVINLDGFSLESISTSVYSRNMFKGCSSIEKVVLGNVAYKTGDTDATIVPTAIGPSMFEGCTSLAEIDFENIKAVMDSAFKGCSSLSGDYYYDGDPNVGNAFALCGGLVFRTDSTEKALALYTSLKEAGITAAEAMVAGMSHRGFSVRTVGYNGLRSVFSFAGENNLTPDGYTLVEYGALCGAAQNYSKYTNDFGSASSILTLDGKEFKTPEKIVKTPIYVSEGYVGEAKNKVLNDDGTVDFTVTIIKFAADHYQTDFVMTGYEIWVDEAGNYKVIYSEVENPEYKQTSLYSVTFGMLFDKVIEIGDEDSPVYKMMQDIPKTYIETGHSEVEAYLIDHHIYEGKKIAIFSTESETPIVLESINLGDEIGNVVSFVFDGNVSCDIPKLDDYWLEHVNAQIGMIPEGRSFIAITDTHYPSNAGKSADLMEYVRKMTGIKKVINLGDPYHDGKTHDIALGNLELSMETKFFDYFGEDGMYAIGNHDSNLTKARSTGDDNSNTYKMDLLLSDKEIYDLTFTHIEEGGNKNGNIVYDEALLSIIEANKDSVKEFVLDNVAAEDAAEFNNMFGDVSYTAEEMYENLVCWAKMHYAYYDHESKICYIVLNTGGLTVTDFAILNRELWKFHPSQFEFLNTILGEISESYSDYDVIVAGHMFYDRSVANESYNSSLFKMLSAFEGGTSVSFSASGNNAFSGKLFGCENNEKSRTLSYDFSDRSFTGDVICLTGHRHLDLDLVSQTKDGKYYMSVPYDEVADNLSDNAIQLILLNQDNYNESKGANEDDSDTMVKGTVTEHCFTIFTLTDDNTLVATRIGATNGWSQKVYRLGSDSPEQPE